jgi:hypothetical protein
MKVLDREARRLSAKQKSRNCFLICMLFAFILSSCFSAKLFPRNVSAQTPYEVVATIGSYETNYHLIYGVNVNDLVLITINPGSYFSYQSSVRFPNVTLIQSNTAYGSHSYSFTAQAAGTYLLGILTSTESATNYTAKCSHQISTDSQATPYKIPDQIQTASTNYHIISGVEANELVLAVVSPAIYSSYSSSIAYPNLTLVSETTAYFSHYYRFIADAAGDYLLKITTSSSSSFNYTVKS